MAKFRESQTAKNLLTSYAFESQATTRYIFFSDQAALDGYAQVAGIFRETADQECEHALRFFKFFNGGELEITASFLTGALKSTTENLVASADLEHFVHTELYPGFATMAREEGFIRAADLWDAIITAERQHESTFRTLADNLDTGRAFARQTNARWRCLNCGYIHEGSSAPDTCPACVRPATYFELFVENW